MVSHLVLDLQVRKLKSEAEVEDGWRTDTAKLNHVTDLDVWIIRVYGTGKLMNCVCQDPQGRPRQWAGLGRPNPFLLGPWA